MYFTAKCFTLLLALFVAGGCSATHPSKVPQDSFPAMAALKRQIAEHGVITLRSNNGIAYRTDGDTELIFYPNGDAVMLEWGFSGTAYRGNYHLRKDGCLVSSFKEFHNEWPAMTIFQEEGTFVLKPQKIPVGDISDPGYWQFRMLTGEDEKKVLQTAKEWLGESPSRVEAATMPAHRPD